jgi:ABC-2 type transport system permease protein
MTAAPGSPLWLLYHEFRLQRRTANKKPAMLALAAIGVLFLHLIAFPLAIAVSSLPPIPPAERVYLCAGVTGGAIFLFLTMVSTTLIAAMQAIYGRGDMDLMLSSPIAPRSIVLVRCGVIAINACKIVGFLILPFANAFGLLVSPRWFAAYLALPCLALLATAVSLAAALGLYQLMGPRRTRVFAQILGALIGMVGAIAPQVFNTMSSRQRSGAVDRIGGYLGAISWPGPDSPIWLPARVVMGEPLPLAIAVVLCVSAFALVSYGFANRFIASIVAANGTARGGGRRKASTRRFRTTTIAVMRRKEIRLIARDPWLLTQVLQQAACMLPLGMVAWRFNVGGVSAAWLVIVPITGGLASAFAWLTISGESMPDLIAAAPLRSFDVLRAKFEAALLLAGLALLPLIAIAWYANPWLGQTMLVCCTGAAVTNTLSQLMSPSHRQRNEFNRRGQGRVGAQLLETLYGIAWAAAAAGMLVSGWWALASLLLVALPLMPKFFAWLDSDPEPVMV